MRWAAIPATALRPGREAREARRVVQGLPRRAVLVAHPRALVRRPSVARAAPAAVAVT